MPGTLVRLIGGDLAALTQDACGEFVRRSRQGGVVPLRISPTARMRIAAATSWNR